MFYVLSIMFFCFVGGLVGVASNPSPYFGAVGLVVSAAFGCGVLVELGGSFVALILFLIYLGGMLVVFAYSVALASDRYPETWGNWSVGLSFVGYLVLLIMLWGYFVGGWGVSVLEIFGEDYFGVSCLRVDLGGVSLMYSSGGWGLLVCGWGLLLTLFVVLELTRGISRGCLRAI